MTYSKGVNVMTKYLTFAFMNVFMLTFFAIQALAALRVAFHDAIGFSINGVST